MPREIVIEISEDGKEVTIEAFGYKGKGCVDEIMAFAKDIGKASVVTRKKEFYRITRTCRARRRARLRGRA